MLAQEPKVSPHADYYVYTPSTLARKLYFYPLYTGYFIYEPGYYIERKNYNNFLIMYITKGSCTISTENRTYTASAGQFVLLDCYQSHKYGSDDAWESAWLHFDGPLARTYFEEITSLYGHILSPPHSEKLSNGLIQICDLFRNSAPLIESVMSDYITKILNGLLSPAPNKKRGASHTSSIADIIAYINEHFHEPISLDELAAKSNLSLYHFTRVFTKETGNTPHHYIMLTRLSAAKFLLKSSGASIKDIAFNTGFNSESSFCSTFKKLEKCTPSQYRENGGGLKPDS